MNAERRCALCGDPIEDGQAWLVDDTDPSSVAHSGCVYGSDEPEGRSRWRPAEIGTAT